jgi:hypothetical protein
MSPRGLAASAPDVALAVIYLVVWIAPDLAPRGTASWLMFGMMLEFIIIHSSAFMGTIAFSNAPPRARALTMIGLGGFYTLFVGSIALITKSLWPLVSFWLLLINRVLGVLLGQSPKGEEKRFIAVGWGVSVLFYLAGAFITTLFPIPHLGVTPSVVDSFDLPGSGLWVEQPHRVLAFGFLYYAGIAVSEAFDHRWMRPSHVPAASASTNSSSEPRDRAA